MLRLLSAVLLLLLLLLSSSLPVNSFDVYPDGVQTLVYKVLNQVSAAPQANSQHRGPHSLPDRC
jgi:hypothetical protein